MNNKRRQELKKAVTLLNEANNIVDRVLDEERDCFDNLPENFQESDRGIKMEESADCLESAINNIDEAINCVDNAIN